MITHLNSLRRDRPDSNAVPRCLTQGLADVPVGYDWLCDGERQVLEGKRFVKRRADWRLGRWTAKCCVAASGRTSHPRRLADIEIRAAADGAPEVFFGGAPAGVAVSISHSAGLGLAAVAPAGSFVGCDVERIAPRSMDFVEDFFTTNERRLVMKSGEAGRSLLATLIWSAEESALKTLRQGLRSDTRNVEVQLTGAPDRLEQWTPLKVEVDGATSKVGGWWCCAGEYVLVVTAKFDYDWGEFPPHRVWVPRHSSMLFV